jgi:hypothetical protein
MSDKEKQILSILSGSTTQYISKKLGKCVLTQADFRESYNVTLNDIIIYVEKNGLPKESYYNRPGLKDGLYLLENIDGFIVYYQEKGCKFNPKTFVSIEEAIVYLVREKVNYSGVFIT